MRIWLDKTVDEEFEDLGTQGHTGTLNDRQFTFLATLSHTGSLADRMGSFIAGGRVVDTTAPVVTSSSYDGGTTTVSLDIVEASGSATCYWALVANPSTPTEAQVVAGTGGGILEAGSFTVTSGGDTDLIDVTDVTGNEIHIVIKDAAGNSTGTPSAGNKTVITGVTVTPASTYDYVLDFGVGSNGLRYDYTANTIFNATQADNKTDAGGYWFAAYFYYDGVTSPTALLSIAASGSTSGYGVLYADKTAWRAQAGAEQSSTTIGALGSAGWYFITGHIAMGPTANGSGHKSSYRFWRNGAEATAYSVTQDYSAGIDAVDRFGLGYLADSTPSQYSDTSAFSFAWGHGVPDLMHSWVYNSGSFRNISDYDFGSDANGATLQGFWTAARSGSATFDVADAALDDTVSTLDTPTEIGTMAWANQTTPW